METIDRAAEWRRLKDLYRTKSDEELASIGAEAYDLTDLARQALAAEITSRNLPIELQMTPPETDEPIYEEESDREFDPEELGLIVVRRVWDEQEARRAKAALDHAGIPSYLGDENAEKVDNFKAGFEGGADLKVRDVDQQWASRVLSEIPQEPAGAQTNEIVEPRCPNCHSMEIVFKGRASENSEDLENEPRAAHFDDKYFWVCDECGHEWEDDGVIS